MIFLFGWQNFAILQKLFLKKEYSDTNSLFLKKKSCQKKEFLKSTKICHNCLQYERVLKEFLLSYSEYCQNWLYILMDNGHLSNITKLKTKTVSQLTNSGTAHLDYLKDCDS
jgi:hypothetical protein